LEKQTENLISTARNERSYNDLQVQLNALKSKIEQNRATDFVRFKDEIVRVLEHQIAFHYRLEAGRAEVSLGSDPEIGEANKVLSDADAYKKILSSH
jgi:carboxyl-terminal processing protease